MARHVAPRDPIWADLLEGQKRLSAHQRLPSTNYIAALDPSQAAELDAGLA